MTALDRKLAQTFRAARWESTDGIPGCPDCFDGDDLETSVYDPLTPGLSRYHCTVCKTNFSDVKGTVFQTVKPVPIALWAYLVLLGDPARIAGITPREVKRCWELFARIKGSERTRMWREQLDAAGITAEQLRKYLGKQRRAA